MMAGELFMYPEGTGDTIGVHPDYTTPFNADFDGDEMNIHVPQTAASRADARNIMHVINCLANAASGLPTMSLIQQEMPPSACSPSSAPAPASVSMSISSSIRRRPFS